MTTLYVLIAGCCLAAPLESGQSIQLQAALRMYERTRG